MTSETKPDNPIGEFLATQKPKQDEEILIMRTLLLQIQDMVTKAMSVLHNYEIKQQK